MHYPAPRKLSERLIDAMPWLDTAAVAMRRAYRPLLGQEAPRTPRDILYGVWLGHPLHPAIVTLPIGFWAATTVFDLVEDEPAADLMLGLGLVSAFGAAASGAAQWQDAGVEREPLRLGALHALLNSAGTLLYAGSWLARRRGARGPGVALALAGLGLSGASAWLGGDLAYDLGIGVDRTAFERPPAEWTDVLAEADLVEGTPRPVDAAGASVFLFRRGGEISAIGATCSHLGAPLAEGRVEGDDVICPWHGSVFCLRDGKVRHGPATVRLPAYEVRVADGRIAVRRPLQGKVWDAAP